MHLFKSLVYLAGMVLLACGLSAYRQHHTQTIHYAFLYWNLLLALIPLGVSLPLFLFKEASKKSLLAWPILGLWLLFFPNAPYMISDLMHIYRPSPMPFWYDPLMLGASAFSGVYSGFLSLWIVEKFLRLHWPQWLVNLSVFMIWWLTGLGIYLGRISRWNSWDLWQQPSALFDDIVGIILHPGQHGEASSLIVLYSVFLILNYGFWRSLMNHPPELAQKEVSE